MFHILRVDSKLQSKNSVLGSWLQLDAKDFYFNVGKDNFEGAQAYCINQGGKLFEPKKANVNKNITDLAKSRGINEFWIGIHEKFHSQEGSFVYASDDTPIIWDNCSSGNPDDYRGNQDCVQRGHGPDDTWDDLSCDSLR